MSDFIPCLELCRLYYDEAVRPIMDSSFPHLPYSAAMIGRGSDVLGYDDEMSCDHDWGPRAMLFLGEEDHTQYGVTVRNELRLKLPSLFRGHRTDFRPSEEPEPCVEVLSLRGFFLDYLNFDILSDIELGDWFTFPEHKLLSVTAGTVYHDLIGLQAVRDRFAYYPHEIWLYLLASGWARIGQEEHVMGRAGVVGDEIGSAIIGSRLVRDLIRLCFLMEKQYAPYPKWFGTAFGKLRCACDLSPILMDAHVAPLWKEREEYLCMAYEYVARMHNSLGITAPLPPEVSTREYRPSRPFRVIGGNRFTEAICACIEEPEVKRLAQRGLFGSIDQVSDSQCILPNAYWRRVLRKLYELGMMENPPAYGCLDSDEHE